MPAGKHCPFRIPRDTGRVLWQITNVCNYRCGYCSFSSRPEKDRGELTTEEACRAAGELERAGFKAFKITGGEPFMRGDLLNILESAAARGVSFDLSTNASLVNAEKAARLAALNPAMVHVGLDGHTASIHEAVRGRGTFGPTTAGLRRLVQAGVRVRAGCVIFTGNEGTLAKMVRFAAEAGCAEIIFSKMAAEGRLQGDTALCSKRAERVLAGELDCLQAEYAGRIKVSHALREVCSANRPHLCPGADRFLFVDHLGRVAPCTWLLNSHPQFLSRGSLKLHALAQLLEEPAIHFFKEYQREKEYGCPA